jgi:hypothetical protein
LVLVRQDITGPEPYTGEELEANYLYFDEEEDPEAPDSVLYQWYRGDSADGTFTAITDETGRNYTTTSADDGKYLKVGITLTASTGFTEGTEVLSEPTCRISLPPS